MEFFEEFCGLTLELAAWLETAVTWLQIWLVNRSRSNFTHYFVILPLFQCLTTMWFGKIWSDLYLWRGISNVHPHGAHIEMNFVNKHLHSRYNNISIFCEQCSLSMQLLVYNVFLTIHWIVLIKLFLIQFKREICPKPLENQLSIRYIWRKCTLKRNKFN